MIAARGLRPWDGHPGKHLATATAVVPRWLRTGDVAGRHGAGRHRDPVHEFEFEWRGETSEDCGSASGDVGVDDELVLVDESEPSQRRREHHAAGGQSVAWVRLGGDLDTAYLLDAGSDRGPPASCG